MPYQSSWGFIMPKASLKKNKSATIYLALSASYKRMHTFLKSMLNHLYKKKSKVGDLIWGWFKMSLFNSYRYVWEAATPFPGLIHFTLDPYLIMLSVKQGDIKYHFGMSWPGTEPRSPRPLANTLLIRPAHNILKLWAWKNSEWLIYR